MTSMRIRTGRILMLVWPTLVLASAVYAADPIPIGPEIVVSADSIDHAPRVSSDSIGNFMIVWEFDDTVRARRFYANSNEHLAEFPINDPDHEVKRSLGVGTATGSAAIAGDAAGNFVVTYTALTFDDYYNNPECYFMACVFTRQNDANGNTSSKTFTVLNPQFSDAYAYRYGDNLLHPEIGSLGNGEFLVAWQGYDLYSLPGGGLDADNTQGVFGARTTPKGQKIGNYFQVNEFGKNHQGYNGDLAAAGDAQGNFVVVFRSEYATYEGSGLPVPGGSVRARLYDDNGNPLSGEFGISIDDASDGYYVDVARAPDGTFMVVWDEAGIQGRIFSADGTPITDDFAIGSSDGKGAEVAAGDSSFVVVRTDGQVVGKRFDLAGNALTGDFQVNTTPGGAEADVASAPSGDFVVTWNVGNSPRAQVFRIEPTIPLEMPLPGKSLIVTNRLPDDPERNKGKWKAKDEGIVVPGRGTDSDPRCNGAPPGTVNAALRFWSDASGHDSGTILLPCENWKASGSNKASHAAKRGYKYSDSKLAAGPCNSIKISNGKSLVVSCKGKSGVQAFPFDLVPGTTEGTVNALLEIGTHRYCSSFPAFFFDGSDGRKFLGRNASAPSAPCPSGVLGQCGNGIVGIDEVCDDGNTADGDYCSFNCKRITAVCGDGVVGPGEVCDDGNLIDGDGCSSTCT